MTFKSILENTPVAASAHMFSGHCKKDNPSYAAGKSYFTDNDGNELTITQSLNFINDLKDKASSLAQKFGHAEKKADGVDAKAGHMLRLIKSSDSNNVAIAFSNGSQTGLDPFRNPATSCQWIVFVITKKLVSGRHSWATCYPATDNFVQRHLA